MTFVIKADGKKQFFDRSKIYKTCIRMHANPEQARYIVKEIENRVYNGITTKKILDMIFAYMKKLKPEFKYRIDLREAISRLRSKPDFENFVALLLKSQGYEIEQNIIIQGLCVEHEIDIIARKNDEIIFVEVKHHINPHTYTGLDIFLQINSTFQDLKDGYKKGITKINFNKALVVCNTKISEHAKRYAECKGIKHIGWKYPRDSGLEKLIEENRLYPITFSENFDKKIKIKLGDAGIVLLKQLLEYDIDKIQRKTNISKNKIEKLVKIAKEILK